MTLIRHILNAITPNPKLTNQQILKQMKYLYNKNKLTTNQQHLNHIISSTKHLSPSHTIITSLSPSIFS